MIIIASSPYRSPIGGKLVMCMAGVGWVGPRSDE
jgi:hypothetical protein